MKDSLGRPIGRIEKSFLFDQLMTIKGDIDKTPVPTGDNQGYQLGYQLGLSDALKQVCSMLADLPETEQIKQDKKTGAWHHST